jgi:hypothetical protein
MTSTRISVTPPAGSTMLFQIGWRLRPVRHLTSHIQATVAAIAAASASGEKAFWKPGESLATLAAIFAGAPVCMAT